MEKYLRTNYEKTYENVAIVSYDIMESIDTIQMWSKIIERLQLAGRSYTPVYLVDLVNIVVNKLSIFRSDRVEVRIPLIRRGQMLKMH